MEPQLYVEDIDNMMKTEQRNFDFLMKRIAQNGPSDTTATADLAAVSARFAQLETIKRGYLIR